MAKASGLELLALKDRNPLITSTYGTGQLIKAAIDEGMHKIIIGIGEVQLMTVALEWPELWGKISGRERRRNS